MATIELRLSPKGIGERKEIMLRFFHGRNINTSCGSEHYILPEHFKYYIDRKSAERLNINLGKADKATTAEAAKKGWPLRNSGEIVITERIETPSVKHDRDEARKIDEICSRILAAFSKANPADIDKAWLKNVIGRYNRPEEYLTEEERNHAKTIYEIGEDYISAKEFSYDAAKGVRVLLRTLARHEAFVRGMATAKGKRMSAEDKRRALFTWNLSTCTKEDVEDFIDFVANERALAEEYPHIYDEAVTFAEGATSAQRKKKANTTPELRGANVVLKYKKRLKAFFAWLRSQGLTSNNPFEGMTIGAEVYKAPPYYITTEERNAIAAHDLSSRPALEVQRDIFIFQCLVGCRVGDLMRFTSRNINAGVLEYVPHKTEGKSSAAPRVPLNAQALALVEKYKGVDAKGRLFPYISPQKYNDAIKEVFTECGVTRCVQVQDAVSGEVVSRPINEVASSHLARRTFVGGLYAKVKDPNLIGRMSGHVEGSTAFRRYRDITDNDLRDTISLLD